MSASARAIYPLDASAGCSEIHIVLATVITGLNCNKRALLIIGVTSLVYRQRNQNNGNLSLIRGFTFISTEKPDIRPDVNFYKYFFPSRKQKKVK